MSRAIATMEDIRRATGSSALVGASLFAGAGGSSLGYRLAGFRIAYANEFDSLAADAYALNADRGTVLDRRDVREVRGDEILRLAQGEVDLFDGSPPCQGFSLAGKRNLEDENCSLYWEFVRLVGEVAPKAFCAENVTGFVMGCLDDQRCGRPP
jgi:DNA (cytosine-5)-methyltransferase 1